MLSGKYNDGSKEKRVQKLFETNNPMTAVFVNERNLIIAKEVQRRAKETNDTIASSLKLDRSSKKRVAT